MPDFCHKGPVDAVGAVDLCLPQRSIRLPEVHTFPLHTLFFTTTNFCVENGKCIFRFLHSIYLARLIHGHLTSDSSLLLQNQPLNCQGKILCASLFFFHINSSSLIQKLLQPDKCVCGLLGMLIRTEVHSVAALTGFHTVKCLCLRTAGDFLEWSAYFQSLILQLIQIQPCTV